MMNMTFIKEAAKLAFQLVTANYMPDTYASVLTRAKNWYGVLDLDSREPVATEILAAMVLYGDYKPECRLEWDDIYFIHDYWFPMMPPEYTEDYCTYIHY